MCFECVELNKFEGVATEEDLVDRGLDYIEKYKLWAGLVFDLDPTATEVPPTVKYKIRQSVQMVDTTARYRVLDRLVRPTGRKIVSHHPLIHLFFVT